MTPDPLRLIAWDLVLSDPRSSSGREARARLVRAACAERDRELVNSVLDRLLLEVVRDSQPPAAGDPAGTRPTSAPAASRVLRERRGDGEEG